LRQPEVLADGMELSVRGLVMAWHECWEGATHTKDTGSGLWKGAKAPKWEPVCYVWKRGSAAQAWEGRKEQTQAKSMQMSSGISFG
jgi:hypothetical protein